MVGEGLAAGLQQSRFHAGDRKREGGKVLVVLIGWWMAKERHLSKYIPIWEEQGCSTLSFIPSSNRFRFGRIAKQLLSNLNEYLQKEKEDEVRIIFHVFSNNGLMCFNAFLQETKNKIKYLMVRRSIYGCIFDSCPGFLTLTAGLKAFSAANKNSWINNRLFQVICYILSVPLISKFFRSRHIPYYIGMFATSYLLSWLRNKHYHSTFVNNLQILDNCKSKLFLYSNADELCTSDAIKSSITRVRELDASKDQVFLKGEQRCQIFEKYFEGSGHVAHFLTYPAPYKRACMKILDRVLFN